MGGPHCRRGQYWKNFRNERAKIVEAPQDAFTVSKEKSVFAKVKLINNTDWPLKNGCKIVNTSDTILEDVCFPLDQNVGAMQEY
mmetsp:Transcript_9785/g.16476  ORF Transcript_9785/g.16476 Transcript_9785/m.16476 type:complete len:84 (+) Transcript_9785:1533-1784(+)